MDRSTFRERPLYELLEFLGECGGYIGIIVGVSAADVVAYAARAMTDDNRRNAVRKAAEGARRVSTIAIQGTRHLGFPNISSESNAKSAW